MAGTLEHDLGSLRILEQAIWLNQQAQDRERETIAFAAGREGPVPIAYYRNAPALAATFRTHRLVLGNINFYRRDLRKAFQRVQALIALGDVR